MAIQAQRRRHKRFAYATQVALARLGSIAQVVGEMIDVGAGGCRIRFETPVVFESGCLVEVRLPSSSGCFAVLGAVRRREESGHVLGIWFSQTNERGRPDLQRLLMGLEKFSAFQDASQQDRSDSEAA